MQESAHMSVAARESTGAREVQANLYREIGISAVAAALHSINKPEPGKTPALATQPPAGRVTRAS